MRLVAPFVCAAALLPAVAAAATLTVDVEVPTLNVAEYHRPYVALWLEPAAGEPVNLAVWYDLKLKDNEGEKWLKDMRLWWRKTGRTLTMPVDGVSGATRVPGRHTVTFAGDQAPLAGLPAGDYTLHVEAAREVGGREVVSIPFTWPAPNSPTEARGNSELGRIRVAVE